jgi:hypothetical protein
MQIVKDHYFINYIANDVYFKINIFNQITNKCYETIKIIDEYKIHISIDIDILKIITKSFLNDNFEIIDMFDHLNLIFIWEIIKIKIDCSNIECYETLDILHLKMENAKLKKQLEKRDMYIDNILKLIPKYVNVYGYTVNKFKKCLIILDKYMFTHDKFVIYFLTYTPFRPTIAHYNSNYFGMFNGSKYGKSMTPMETEINQLDLNIPCTIFTEKINIIDILLIENNILTFIGVNIINFDLLADFKGDELHIINCMIDDTSYEKIYECFKSLKNIKILTIHCISETINCFDMSFINSMSTLHTFKTNNNMDLTKIFNNSIKIEIIE